jgi:membrane protein DedA with SNARE-associated domain
MLVELLEQVRLIIEQVITVLGYPGIGLVMFAENVFPPIPSELVMPLAGFLVADGDLSLGGVLLAGTLGAVAGALVLYGLGRWLDEPVIRAFVRRYGQFFLLDEDDLDRTMRFFTRYGQVMVFFGRLVPMVRSLISIPAGMNRMPLGRFLISTTLGTLIWNGLLVGLGMLLGENWPEVLAIVKQYEQVTLLAIGALVVGFVVIRLRGRRWRVGATSDD